MKCRYGLGKALAVLLSFVLLAGSRGITVLADELPAQDETAVLAYVDAAGNEMTPIADYTVIDETTTSLESGWYAVTESVTNDNRITVTGSVDLILCDGAKLTAGKGITLTGANSLTIWQQAGGSGELEAIGSDSSAGIGGVIYSPGGILTINGGKVAATGGYRGAGIGGGRGYAGSGGTITINAGTVTAIGGAESAGIGGGRWAPGGNITINGGTVTACGSDYSAGIGGGYDWDGGVITITGGKITATGGKRGSGIGGGGNYSKEKGVGGAGTITISGGEINATGGEKGPGIGLGYNGQGGTITIDGGMVNAVGGLHAAGIGGGEFAGGGTIIINDGTVIATAAEHGAGIGGGHDGPGGNITINGGSITATGGESGAGIGGGCNADGGVTRISGGEITATGGERAAGIGGGNNMYADGGEGAGGTIIIDAGTVTAISPFQGAGIGGGYDGPGGSITINGGTVTASCYNFAAGIGGGYQGDGGVITVNGGMVTANGGDLASAIGGGYEAGGGTITITGGNVTANGAGQASGIGDGNNGSGGTITLTYTAESRDDIRIISKNYSAGSVALEQNFIEEGTNRPFNAGNYAGNTELNGRTLIAGTAYKVAFDSDGGSDVETQYVNGGETAREPEVPGKDGFTFMGWQLDGEKYDFGTPVIGDITLRAVWSRLWPELQEKINGAADGETITLTENVIAGADDAALIVSEDKNITIDLNGFTIDRALTEARENGNVITVKGGLTIVDSGEGGRVTGGWNFERGGGIYVSGGALTLMSGSISGNKAATQDFDLGRGGGVFTAQNGSFTMSGGDISGNDAESDGGGVYIYSGSFEMNGGTISANTAGFSGGGVFLSDGSASFTMNGGSVTGNSALQTGGGVYASYDYRDNFNLSGSPVITGNTAGEADSNVHLAEYEVINIAGSLSDEASVGVTMKTPLVFTNGLEGKGTKENFTSDSNACVVGVNDDGEAFLGVAVTVTFDPDGGTVTEAQSLFAGDKARQPADPVKDGYIFKGWYQVNDDGVPADSAFDFENTIIAFDITLKAVWEEKPEPALWSHSLILSGQIGVTFYMDLPGDITDYADSYMEFTVSGKTQQFAFSRIAEKNSTRTHDGKIYYGFICYVNTIQMAEEITAVYRYGEEQAEELRYTYSVKEYVDYIVANKESFSDKVFALVEAIANMGHYVQPYLSDARGWTIGEDYAEMEKISEMTADRIAEAKEGSRAFAATSRAEDGNKLSYSLILDTETMISVYLETESTGTVTAQINGADAEVRKSGKYYQVKTAGISAHKLGDRYTVTFFKDGEEAGSVDVTALSYVCAVLNADAGTYTDAAVRAVASIYHYYKSAIAYRS